MNTNREPQELIELTGTMMTDFAERMAEIRKESGVSLHVRRTVDYIYCTMITHFYVTFKDIFK